MTATEIKQLREDLGMSQSQFAKIFSVSQTAVAHWETGRTLAPPFYVATMIKLREKVNSTENREDLTALLLKFLLVGGIVAFLTWLFSNDD